MKNMMWCVMIIVASHAAAQEETLFSGSVEHGGFGAPVLKVSTVKKHFAVFAGAYGGWLINHSLLIGAGGYGLVSHIGLPPEALIFRPFDTFIRLQFGYGGIVLEYIGHPMDLIHYSVAMLVGGGAVVYSEHGWLSEGWNTSTVYPTSTVFVFEPGVNVELNVTSFLRVAAGGSYRFVNGVELAGLSNADLGGPSLNLALKFGSF